MRNPFASLKGDGGTSAALAADVREAGKALAEAETRAGEVENAARADALDALAGGKAVKEGAADLAAARLRVSAMQSGIDALKAKLRARLESEHADARRAAEKELAECATADAKISAEIAEQAVKLLRLIVQRRGHKISPVIALALCDVATGAMFPSGVTGWQFMEAAAHGGDATARALREAVESVAGLPDNAERRTAAKNVLAAPFDADAQVTALLKSGAPPAAE